MRTDWLHAANWLDADPPSNQNWSRWWVACGLIEDILNQTPGFSGLANVAVDCNRRSKVSLSPDFAGGDAAVFWRFAESVLLLPLFAGGDGLGDGAGRGRRSKPTRSQTSCTSLMARMLGR